MSKHHLVAFLALCFFTACRNKTAVEFDISTPGISNAVVLIKGDKQFGENIKNGKCVINDIIEEPGFYQLQITEDQGRGANYSFEIYAEPVKYSIALQKNQLTKYPDIVTDSKMQAEVSAYYKLADSVLASKINDKYADIKTQPGGVPFFTLAQFVKQHPQSELAAHFMLKQNYKDQPILYAGLFKKLSEAAKNSHDGKELGDKLGTITSLLPGQKAPAISGRIYDGRTFSDITKGKKIFLLDFWKAGYNTGRDNHAAILQVFEKYQSRGFQVISVALNNKELWWTGAVKDEQLPWPQICDLKGDDSPNAKNYNISTVPTYYIVDQDWKIIETDVPKLSIEAYVMEYLDKHD